jgi:hypothetical protein
VYKDLRHKDHNLQLPIDLLVNSVQTCHQHSGKAQVGIAGGIRGAEFKALGFGSLGISGNSYNRTAVGSSKTDTDWSFIARYQAFIGIGTGVGNGQESGSVSK